jgi:putative FmdB family regulatory protein
MPFYEYQCKACGAQVEVLQKITDAPLKKCPECGKSQLTKLVSAPVFRLKGAGWYETDFKTDQDKKRNLVESEPAAAPKAEEKSGAKPEAKAEKPEAKAEKPAVKPVARKAKKKAARPAAKARARR